MLIRVQCAGNRRAEMSDRGVETEGLQWEKGVAACVQLSRGPCKRLLTIVSNLQWTGVTISSLLREAGLPRNALDDASFANVHIEFISQTVGSASSLAAE